MARVRLDARKHRVVGPPLLPQRRFVPLLGAPRTAHLAQKPRPREWVIVAQIQSPSVAAGFQMEEDPARPWSAENAKEGCDTDAPIRAYG